MPLMTRRGPIDRVLTPVRTGTAALAIAVALAVLVKIPLIGTFRAALVVLAALEVLSFGWRTLSLGAPLRAWVEVLVKLAVLAAAYVALAQ